MSEQIDPQRVPTHTKPRKTSLLFSVIALLLIALFTGVSAQAEGSKDLVKNGGYRPYIEWYLSKVYYSGQTASQAVLKRRQIVHVYAKAGETLYFGSSVFNALTKNWIYHDNTYPSRGTIQDIRITTPSGAILDYDVSNDPLVSQNGYIEDCFMELKGPSRWTPGGYDALTYTVPLNGAGIYTFEFYSPSGTGASDPHAYPIGAEAMSGSYCWGNNGSSVDAWDITVADTNGHALTGRVFMPYLTITMGSLSASRSDVLQSVVYVLTDDGYVYETDFNGINPNGFLFFGNNRGLLDLVNDRSLYHSSIYTANDMLRLLGQTGFHLPNEADTAKDKTYRIFLNEPNTDVLQYLRLETPIPPADISAFSFNGGQAARPGAGGDFHFTTTRSCSYELELQFSGNSIYIADFCQAGDNVVHWDGLDYNGDIVPAGQWTAILRTKGGEYHFPIADAETCYRGLQIRLISTPPSPDPGFDPSLIYYDNSTKVIGGETLDFDSGRDAFLGPLTQLQGVSSQKDGSKVSQALRYVANADMPTGYGDLKFFDTWTHYTSSAYTRNLTFAVSNGPTPSPPPTNSPAPPTISPAPPTLVPVPPTNIPAPSTGDSGHPTLWLLLLIGSAVILLLTLTVATARTKASPVAHDGGDALDDAQTPPRKQHSRK